MAIVVLTVLITGVILLSMSVPGGSDGDDREGLDSQAGSSTVSLEYSVVQANQEAVAAGFADSTIVDNNPQTGESLIKPLIGETDWSDLDSNGQAALTSFVAEELDHSKQLETASGSVSEIRPLYDDQPPITPGQRISYLGNFSKQPDTITFAESVNDSYDATLELHKFGLPTTQTNAVELVADSQAGNQWSLEVWRDTATNEIVIQENTGDTHSIAANSTYIDFHNQTINKTISLNQEFAAGLSSPYDIELRNTDGLFGSAEFLVNPAATSPIPAQEADNLLTNYSSHASTVVARANLQWTVESGSTTTTSRLTYDGALDTRRSPIVDQFTGYNSPFDVEIISTNSPYTAGDAISPTIRVTNRGPVEDTQRINFTDFNGNIVDSEWITLKPGESQAFGDTPANTLPKLTWNTDSSDAGTGDITFESATDSAQTQIEIIDPPYFNVDITDADVNGDLTVDAEITNTGGVRDTQFIDLCHGNCGGSSIDTSPAVTLDPSQSQSVTLTWSDFEANNEGDKTITVASEDDTDSTTADAGQYTANDLGINFQKSLSGYETTPLGDEYIYVDDSFSLSVDYVTEDRNGDVVKNHPYGPQQETSPNGAVWSPNTWTTFGGSDTQITDHGPYTITAKATDPGTANINVDHDGTGHGTGGTVSVREKDDDDNDRNPGGGNDGGGNDGGGNDGGGNDGGDDDPPACNPLVGIPCGPTVGI